MVSSKKKKSESTLHSMHRAACSFVLPYKCFKPWTDAINLSYLDVIYLKKTCIILGIHSVKDH